ncbi:MAG TPA: helix-hairpin-helix domain-containing protein [Thermoanaerobaculia bacterium]|jgi:competence protein ComEA
MQASRTGTRIRASALAVLLVVGTALVLYAETSETSASSPKVNINTASVTELSYLPRLGSKVAARIVEHRKEKPFARPEELMEVKGIGEKLFVTLKPYVTVSGPTTLNAKVRSSASSSRRSAPTSAKEKSSSTVPSGKGR